MILPAASVLALGLGPLVHWIGVRWGRSGPVLAALDGFVFVSIAGIVVLQVVPEGLLLGGWLAVVATAIGLAVPQYIHRLGEREWSGAARSLLGLALAGLGVHAALDGMALVSGHDGDSEEQAVLAIAVVLHRFPVGLAIWWLVRPRYGRLGAALVVTLIAGGTLVGYWLGAPVRDGMTGASMGAFQAMVAGAVWHVVAHHPPAPELRVLDAAGRFASAAGALAGLGLLVAMDLVHGSGEHFGPLPDLFAAIGTGSAAAIVGFGMLALLRRSDTTRGLRRRIAGVDLGGVLAAAALLGLPAGGLVALACATLAAGRAPDAEAPGWKPAAARAAPGLFVAVALATPVVVLAHSAGIDSVPVPAAIVIAALAGRLVPLGGAGLAVLAAGLVGAGLPMSGAVALAAAGSVRPYAHSAWARHLPAVATACVVGAIAAFAVDGPRPLQLPGLLGQVVGLAATGLVLAGGGAILFQRGIRGFFSPLLGDDKYGHEHHGHDHHGHDHEAHAH